MHGYIQCLDDATTISDNDCTCHIDDRQKNC